jgi:hypothetical protein
LISFSWANNKNESRENKDKMMGSSHFLQERAKKDREGEGRGKGRRRSL